ncbi:phosphoribulokinase [Nocardioides sp. J9]|uniref:phosphoribulokinase n=1 Tax=Nocardioides sp. J9 TaxID=935844 RepID=UPI00119E5DE9|nr:phosphoribulokinase [Nocardioides sp. J9]TWH00517.1 phosphoribulokinase [Nocardioides sp. J9]
MLEKVVAMARARAAERSHPVMLAIAGDSASGKTTLSEGLTAALGADQCLSISIDDYHRHDRVERAALAITPLHPDGNHLDIVEQHLQLLALGRPILKPVYDHATGTLGRPEYVEPPAFVIVEGLLPLQTKLMRACFDVTVYLDPPEDLRQRWKVARDTTTRGYSRTDVLAELARRAPDSEAFVRPQRRDADIVVRFAPEVGPGADSPDAALSADILLRPTIRHPALDRILTEDRRAAVHLRIIRDDDGTPTDCLHVHGHASAHDARELGDAIWANLGVGAEPPSGLGLTGPDTRSEPLALTQLILLHHLLHASSRHPTRDDGMLSRT